MNTTLLATIRFAAPLVAMLALIIAVPTSAETGDRERKKAKIRRSIPPPQTVATPTPQKPRRSVDSRSSATKPIEKPGRSVAARPPKPGKSPSATAKPAGNNNAQASTAGDKSGNKQQTASPAAKQLPTVAHKTGGSSSGRPRTYPYDIQTKSGTITIQDPSQEPRRNPNGDPDIDEGKDGIVSWITDKNMVVRGRLTKEELAKLQAQMPKDQGDMYEEQNKRDGVRGISKHTDIEAELTHLGVPEDEAARIAREVSKNGTVKAREDIIKKTLVDQNLIPSGLENTGRSADHLLDLAARFKDLGGNDTSKMTPEFVADIEKARLEGNEGAAWQKWNDKLTAPAALTPAGTGNAGPGSASAANVGGTTGTAGSAPGNWTRSRQLGGGSAGGTTGKGTGANSGSSSSGSGSANTASQRQSGLAEDRLTRSEGKNPPTGNNTNNNNAGSAGTTATAAPANTNNPPDGDITLEIVEDEAVVEDGGTDGEITDAPPPTPNQGVADRPPPGMGDDPVAPGSWKRGLRPGQVDAIEGAAPKKGGEKENPGEQGTDPRDHTGPFKSKGKNNGGGVSQPLPELDGKANLPPPPDTRPRGEDETVSYPAPDTVDETHPTGGDAGKQFKNRSEQGDVDTPTDSDSNAKSSATPRLQTGRPVEGDGGVKGEAPTPKPTSPPSGQAYTSQPNLTRPPSPTPTPAATAKPSASP